MFDPRKDVRGPPCLEFLAHHFPVGSTGKKEVEGASACAGTMSQLPLGFSMGSYMYMYIT